MEHREDGVKRTQEEEEMYMPVKQGQLLTMSQLLMLMRKTKGNKTAQLKQLSMIVQIIKKRIVFVTKSGRT